VSLFYGLERRFVGEWVGHHGEGTVPIDQVPLMNEHCYTISMFREFSSLQFRHNYWMITHVHTVGSRGPRCNVI
jgi:hypothetical protein